MNDLPGVQICTVRVRGPEAIAAFESEEFDPGRQLQLVRKATWDYENVEVRSESGRIRLGSLGGSSRARSARVSRRVGSQRSGR